MHLTPILDKQKQLSTCLMDCFADTKAVGEATEGWTESSPNYAALMSKSDEILDLINDFKSDLMGKVADLGSLL